MKRILLAGLLVAGPLPAAWGQPRALYSNPVIQVPPQPSAPQVDATAWVCNDPFNLIQSVFVEYGTGIPVIQNLTYFETADTLNYTNNNEIGSNTGFTFDDFAIDNDGNGTNAMSANFINNGLVFAGVLTNIVVPYNFGLITNNFFELLGIFSPPLPGYLDSFIVPSRIAVSATNLASPGLLEVGQAGVLSLHGGNVNLSRATVRVQGVGDYPGGFYALNPNFSVFLTTNATSFPTGSTFNQGIFSEYWGSGEDFDFPPFFTVPTIANFTLPNPFSPSETTSDVPSGSATFPVSVQSLNAKAFANDAVLGVGTELRQVVFINNSDTNVAIDVRYEPVFDQFGFELGTIPTIQWKAVVTNVAGSLVTNTIYLQDNLATNTFLPVLLDPFGQYGVAPIALQQSFRPDDYNFSTTAAFFTNATFTNFNSLPLPNQASYSPGFLVTPDVSPGFDFFSILGVNIGPMTSEIYSRLPGNVLSNIPGRIEITADSVLNLAKAHIDGANYLSLTATNHFAGSAGARIVVPNYDINLASTNGTLSISNLLAPSMPVFSGSVGLWSGIWTAEFTNLTSTNFVTFHVLIISNGLSATAPSVVQNLTLSAGTNASSSLFVSDILNVTSNAQMIAQRLTITTNPPGNPTAAGAIFFESPIITWSGVFPVLQYVTNDGSITTENSAFFESSQQPPFYPTSNTGPYQAFVNHGTISTSDSFFWANYFENTGAGAITNGIAITTNLASISAFGGNITVQANGTALLTNGVFSAPGQFESVNIACNDLVISNHALVAGGALTLQVTNSINSPALGGSAVSTNYWQVGGGSASGFNLLAPAPVTGDLLATTVTNQTGSISGDVLNTWAGADRGPSPTGYTNNVAIGHLILDANQPNGVFSYVGATGSNAIYVDLLEFAGYATNRNGNDDFTALDLDPSIKIYFADAVFPGGFDVTQKVNGHNNGQLQWVTNYNVGIFSSTNVTFADSKVFSFNRARVLDPFLPPVTEPLGPASVMLSLQMTNQPARGLLISWNSPANANNTLYFKTNMSSANWAVLTNFTQGSAGKVSVFDKQRTNAACLYRALISVPQ